mmetsp:Transcript_83050/g.211382  ORF Transcript_83050/g.211382 Transcript_83050/m.211382 type:complete len:317 (+) Transcript_83050:475-1425(+)
MPESQPRPGRRMVVRGPKHKNPERSANSHQHSLNALPRRLDFLRRRWEGNAQPILEQDRAVMVRHGIVHQRAVAVALHVRVETLVRVAPAHATALAAGHGPLREAVEGAMQTLRILGSDHVDEGVAHRGVRAEVHGKIQKVERTKEALRVQQHHQHVPRVVVGQVPQHHCRVGCSSSLCILLLLWACLRALLLERDLLICTCRPVVLRGLHHRRRHHCRHGRHETPRQHGHRECIQLRCHDEGWELRLPRIGGLLRLGGLATIAEPLRIALERIVRVAVRDARLLTAVLPLAVGILAAGRRPARGGCRMGLLHGIQ